MDKKKKQKVIAAISTITFHVIVLAILTMLTLSAVKPEEHIDDGIPVMIGQVEDAAGEGASSPIEDQPQIASEAENEAVEPNPAPTEPAVAPQPTPTPPAQTQSNITQDNEQTIAANRQREEQEAKRRAEEEARKQREAEEARKRREAEEARKRRENEAAQSAQNAMGAFGNSRNNNSGNTQGTGNQGSPDGNSNVGATSGVGGVGVSVTGSRKLLSTIHLTHNDPSGIGTVKINVTVDKDGNPQSATIASRGTSSAANAEKAKQAAMKARYSAGEATETITLTFNFQAVK